MAALLASSASAASKSSMAWSRSPVRKRKAPRLTCAVGFFGSSLPISFSVAVAALILFGIAAPAEATDIAMCSAESTPEAAIEACGRLITSGQFTGAELAKVLFWRGYARDRQG